MLVLRGGLIIMIVYARVRMRREFDDNLSQAEKKAYVRPRSSAAAYGSTPVPLNTAKGPSNRATIRLDRILRQRTVFATCQRDSTLRSR